MASPMIPPSPAIELRRVVIRILIEGTFPKSLSGLRSLTALRDERPLAAPWPEETKLIMSSMSDDATTKKSSQFQASLR